MDTNDIEKEEVGDDLKLVESDASEKSSEELILEVREINKYLKESIDGTKLSLLTQISNLEELSKQLIDLERLQMCNAQILDIVASRILPEEELGGLEDDDKNYFKITSSEVEDKEKYVEEVMIDSDNLLKSIFTNIDGIIPSFLREKTKYEPNKYVDKSKNYNTRDSIDYPIHVISYDFETNLFYSIYDPEFYNDYIKDLIRDFQLDKIEKDLFVFTGENTYFEWQSDEEGYHAEARATSLSVFVKSPEVEDEWLVFIIADVTNGNEFELIKYSKDNGVVRNPLVDLEIRETTVRSDVKTNSYLRELAIFSDILNRYRMTGRSDQVKQLKKSAGVLRESAENLKLDSDK